MKKFLAFIGGIAIALLVGGAIAYGVNEGFRNDVNNVFHIEWSQTDETPDDTTTEDNTTEDGTTDDNSSDIPTDGMPDPDLDIFEPVEE